MPLADIPRAFQAGVGDTLGFVAMVIGLGTVMGKLLAESGGAGVVSAAVIRAMGVRRLDWAMMLSGFIIGLPVFFQVGLVLLAPVMFTVAQTTGTPLLRLGLPLVAGLSTAHGLVPPHPGPVAAMALLHADAGRTLLYSLIVGLPTAIISGPLFARFATARVSSEPGTMAAQLAGRTASGRPPSLAITLLTILMPVLLMLAAALAQALLPQSPARAALEFAGTPLMAMLLSTLLALRHVRHGLRLRSPADPAVRRGGAAADRQRPARRRRRRRLRARPRPRGRRYGDCAGDERHGAVAAGARLADRLAAAHFGRVRRRCRSSPPPASWRRS